MNEKRGVIVICPACRKKGDWFADKYGPFCSERCQLIDLGKWFSAEHAISEPLRPELLKALEDEGGSAADN